MVRAPYGVRLGHDGVEGRGAFPLPVEHAQPPALQLLVCFAEGHPIDLLLPVSAMHRPPFRLVRRTIRFNVALVPLLLDSFALLLGVVLELIARQIAPFGAVEARMVAWTRVRHDVGGERFHEGAGQTFHIHSTVLIFYFFILFCFIFLNFLFAFCS